MKKISKGASSVKIPGKKKDAYKQANKTGVKRIATKKSSKSVQPTMKMSGKMGIDLMGKPKRVPNLQAMKRRGIISSLD